VNCLVATDAATSLTTASAYVHTAVRVLAVTAALATAGQQADSAYSSPTVISVVKEW